ncbi:MAG TPA: hypothetical protein PLU81_14915 [Deltaproteobacteria bacterium]|nr:hypothetical protein [Deltaproteobacteria bacterium]HPJ93705.1 hypothetical protein [Deltaproteobacteria bacterium]HPR53085.1 hypothetical protein [Deltaproteobacteria bacterium]
MRGRKKDVFYRHGYTSIFLDGKWLKATPAFNNEFCERFRLQPPDFKGPFPSVDDLMNVKSWMRRSLKS